METSGGEQKHWLLDSKYGQPIVKDGCGVLGILRKKGGSKISSTDAVRGISCISYRGSSLGAGYASIDCDFADDEPPCRVRAFVIDASTGAEIQQMLEEEFGSIKNPRIRSLGDGRMSVWHAEIYSSGRKDKISRLDEIVDKINLKLISPEGSVRGRIFSFGRYVRIYKEVGYPDDVARIFALDSNPREADAWIAHTRQPTNSPGSLPIWSHPFASMDCAIVHNGDISSFGANMELLNAWGLKSHIGTDSEVIAQLLDRLIRVEGSSIEEAAIVLTSPFERNASPKVLALLSKYRGARLDGPFSVVAAYSDGSDTYLIALTDRSKFRPLILGEDDQRFYVASEESQIRHLSKDAKIWTPEPGSYFIASLDRGLISAGTARGADHHGQDTRVSASSDTASKLEATDASGRSFQEINVEIARAFESGADGIEISNASGQRYLGIGASSRGSSKPFKIKITGYPGNCLANLNNGAEFEVFGNCADDVGDTMHSGSIILHGSARDVLGQAVQGGQIFAQGSAGNRTAIQMRQYRDSRPYMIIGETADDYLGEYMGGGVVCILNMQTSPKPVGSYVGTGMVGGSIYIRGSVSRAHIGLPPHRQDVLNYLEAAQIEGRISSETLARIREADFPDEALLKSLLPKDLFARVLFLFYSSKYSKPLSVEKRKLTTSRDDEQLLQKLEEFFEVFSIPKEKREEILSSDYTVIKPSEESKGMEEEEESKPQLPPSEVPVEE